MKYFRAGKGLLERFGILLGLLLVCGITTVYAAWDGTSYDPGETLDPECTPTDPNCTVDMSGFGDAEEYAASQQGITLDTMTNVFSIDLDGNTLSVSSSGLKIADAYAGQGSITTLGTISAGTWEGSPIGATYGGTGINTTPTDGQILIGNGTGFSLTEIAGTGGIRVTSGPGTVGLAFDPTDLAPLGSAAADDLLVIYDSSTGITKTISQNDLLAGVMGGFNYEGSWDAQNNVPDIGATTPASGTFYIVNVAGNTALDGNSDWDIGDWAVFNGTDWDQVKSSSAVSSVFGRTGIITAQSGDYTASQILNVPSGTISSTNLQAALNEVAAEAEHILATGTVSQYLRGDKTWHTLNTQAVIEDASNLYYTDARARNAFSAAAGTGFVYSTTTGVIALEGTRSLPFEGNSTGDMLYWDGSDWRATSTLAISADNLVEGSANLFYTNARVDARIAASTSTVRNFFSGSSPIGYNPATGVISLSTAGDWTGTFDGLEGSQYLNRANHTGTQAWSTIASTPTTLAGYGITDSTPLARTITASGSGLTGGGDLSANRTFALDFSYLDSRYATSGSGVVSFNGRTGSVVPGSNDYTTSIVAEGSNLYFTNARADARIALGLAGATSTVRSMIGAAAPLSYNSTTGALGVSAGYEIPSTASTTAWNSFYNAPSTRISLGTGLTWTGNTLSASIASSTSPGLVSVGAQAFAGDKTFTGTTALATTTITTLQVGSLAPANLNVSGTTTLGNLNGLVFATNGQLGAMATSSLGLNADAIAEGSTNLFYTNARADGRIAGATTTIRNMISAAVPLSYNPATGSLGVSAGYEIPTTASTTAWNTFYATPSSRISLGSGLGWSGNTITLAAIADASALSPGLVSTSTQTFAGNKTFLGATTLATTTITSLQVGTLSPANLTVTGSTTLGNLNGLVFATNGQLAAVSTSSLGISSDSIAEGSTNQFYTDARVDGRIAGATTTVRGFLSAASPLAYNPATGVLAVAAGYDIPTSTSTTAWNSFYNAPSTRISLGGGLSWSGNTLSALAIPEASALSAGLVSTSTQTFAGNKTFLGATTLATTTISSLQVTTFAPTNLNVSGATTLGNLNGVVFGTNGQLSAIATSSLGINTDTLVEGSSKLFFTNARADARVTLGIGAATSTIRGMFSSAAPALTYNSSTGIFDLTSGYTIPLLASTTDWNGRIGSQWVTNGSSINYMGGRVGIGSSTPLGVLTVKGQTTTTGVNFTTTDSANVRRFTILDSGNVGIGTTTPQSALTVIGDAYISGTITSGALSICTLGVSYNSNGSIVCTLSDARLKNVQEDYVGGLEAIEKLRPVVYTWKEGSGFDTEKPTMGFIAQEVASAIPQAGLTYPDGKMMYNHLGILGAAVNAIKELNAKVKELAAGVFEKITAKEVRTEKLCIGETCVSESELQEFISSRQPSPERRSPDPQPVVPDPAPAGNGSEADEGADPAPVEPAPEAPPVAPEPEGEPQEDPAAVPDTAPDTDDAEPEPAGETVESQPEPEPEKATPAPAAEPSNETPQAP